MATLLAPLGAGRGLRVAGEPGFVVDVSAQLCQLRGAAWARGDAAGGAPDAGLRSWLWPLGLVALLLPRLLAHPFFDSRLTNWIGLVTHKPITEDYVPLLPWLGVLWWGLAAGQWLLAHRRAWLAGPLPRAAAPLATLGRWSLSFYMLHQPLLIGALWLVLQWG